MEYTDKDRLDFLQAQTQGYGGGWKARMSIMGRGYRLHETSQEGAVPNVRDAIDLAILKSITDEPRVMDDSGEKDK